MTKWLKYTIPVALLVSAAVAIAAPVLLPRAITNTDRVPVVNTGTATAYTVSPDQIKAYVFGNNTSSPGVYTFNGRDGAVVSQAGDYTAAQVGADPSGAATTAVANHNAAYNHLNIPTNQQIGAMTGTSGTPSTTNAFVTNSDPRNSNARTPIAHASTHAANGSDPIAVTASQVTGLATIATTGSYTDLSSKPTLGTAAAKDVPATGNASASQVVYGTDTRLTDARTPLVHNQDATTITTGIFDGDRLPAMSSTKKGAVPATGTPSGKYLKDDGTWATVTGGAPLTTASGYPSTSDTTAATPAYVDAALNSGFTISTSDSTQKGKIAGWDATTGVLGAASLPACTGSDKLTSNGTTISCAADQTGTAGSGITTLNGATVSSQSFADGANIHVSTNTGTGTHTIGITGTIPDSNIASAATWNAKQSPQTTLAGYGITDTYTKSFLDAALTGKLDTTTAATTYHTKAAFNAYSAAQSVKLAAKMNDTSGNPDGTRYVWVYNTTACPAAASTPVGALCTLPGGIYQNTGSAWIVPPDVSSGYTLPTASTSTLGGVKVDGTSITINGSGVISSTGGSTYTLPAASASTLGGIKVGSGLAIDGSGVLSATGGGGSGLTVVAPFSGTQTIAVNNRYTTTATSRLTLGNHETGTLTVLAKADTTLVPDTSAGVFTWLNPITRASSSTTAGYSALLKAGTYADIVSNGDSTFQINANANPQATGVNEYTGPTVSSIKDAYQTTGGSMVTIATTAADVYQSGKFTASSSYTATSVDATITKYGAVTGNLCMKLYTDSASLPGTPIATSTKCFAPSEISTSATALNFPIPNTGLISGSSYWIVLYNDTGYNGSNYYKWTTGANTGTYNKKSADGASWANANFNVQPNFQVWGY